MIHNWNYIIFQHWSRRRGGATRCWTLRPPLCAHLVSPVCVGAHVGVFCVQVCGDKRNVWPAGRFVSPLSFAPDARRDGRDQPRTPVCVFEAAVIGGNAAAGRLAAWLFNKGVKVCPRTCWLRACVLRDARQCVIYPRLQGPSAAGC